MKLRGTIVFLIGVLAALGAGWAGFPRVIYQTRRQPVDFSHQVHADKAGSKCDDCHAFRPDGTLRRRSHSWISAPAATPPLMGATAAEKNFIDHYVTPQREPEWLVYARQPENVYFSHITHVKTRQLEVRKMPRRPRHHQHAAALPAGPHQRLFARHLGTAARPAMTMDACVACHRQSHLEHSCLDCHK